MSFQSGVLFILMLIFFGIAFIFSGIMDESTAEYTLEVPCYDKYDNLMKDQICYEDVTSQTYDLATLGMVLTTLFGVIAGLFSFGSFDGTDDEDD